MKKRRIAASIAAALAVNSLLAVPFTSNALDPVIAEFEDGVLENDATVDTELAGFSGKGYVKLWDNSSTIPSATATVTLPEAGTFALIIGYAAPFGNKGATIEVNGKNIGQVTFEESEGFVELNVGKVDFKKGENTVKINSTWGYTIVDYVKVTEYVAPSRPEIKATQTAPCDPKATDEAKALMAYLSSVYGKHILSGQQEIYMYGPHDVEYEFEYIKDKTGDYPAIRGFDYGNFTCPAFGSDDGSTDRVIAWAAKGGLVTASWHLNVPTVFENYKIGDKIAWDATTYTEKTDFSPAKAATEGTKENQYYTQALDTLATEFLKLQDKGIPVIWRPLHEAEGGGGEGGSWFWWGREGSKAYRQLWIYTYKYLTETKGCHNLIWEWNSYDFSTSANWYPGDEYVDIIGYDKYNCTDWSTGQPVLVHNTSAIPDTFYNIMARYNNAKMVAMAECDSFSTLENLTTEKAGWLYFLPWYDGGSDDTNFLTNPMFNTEKDLIDLYTSDYCITLSELPKLSDVEFDPEATNPPAENTEPTDPEEGHASITFDKKSGNYKIDLPEGADTIYIDVEFASGVSQAVGGLGCLVTIGNKYYWVNLQWDAKAEGEVKIVLADSIQGVTLDNKPVEDEDVIEQIKEYLSSIKSFEGQVWWYTGKGDDDPVDPDMVKIVDAYIKKDTAPKEPVRADGEVTESAADNKYVITIPQPSDTIYLEVECDKEVEWGGGCVSTTIKLDGEYYWIDVEWAVKESGVVAVDLTNIDQIKCDDVDVEDEDIIKAVKAAFLEQTTFDAEVWYSGCTANEELDPSTIRIVGAYIMTDGTEGPSAPTEAPTEPISDVLYGDVDCNNTVNLLDVVLLNKNLMLGKKLSELGQANADVDMNGKLNPTDSLNILKYCVKLITLPVED